MKLRNLQKHWDSFGRNDPCWAILTRSDKRKNRWDVKEFFETGQHEVRSLMEYLDDLGVQVKRDRALDFGCGIGRLTQALAATFDRVDGVDIAPSMIEQARQHNTHGERCMYTVNDRGDLGGFEANTFDLIYTCRVLQHIEPQFVLGYLREFVRTLKPDGVLVFSEPTRRVPVHAAANGYRGLKGMIIQHSPRWFWDAYGKWRYWTRGEPIMEAYVIPEDVIRSTLLECGARVVDAVDDGSSGPGYESRRYCAMKSQ